MNRYTTSEVSPSVDDPTEPHAGHPVQRVQAGAALFVVIGTAVAVTLRDPHEPGSFGVCPSLLLFGSYCPGCGTLRGMADLTSGDISATVGHNLLLIPMIVALVAWAVLQWLPRGKARRRFLPGRIGPTWVNIPLIVGITFLIFTVLRNLPGSELAP